MNNKGFEITVTVPEGAEEIIKAMCDHSEIEMNRAWIYDDKDEEIIGETNFVVSEDFAKQAFKKLNEQGTLATKYDDFNDFLETYEPEVDGEAIYQLAIQENQIIENKGTVLY